MFEFDPRTIEREDGRVFLDVRHVTEWAEKHSPLIAKALPESEYVQLAMLRPRIYEVVYAMYSVGADKSGKAADRADEGAAAAIAARPDRYKGVSPVHISEEPRYAVAWQRANECIQEIKDAIRAGEIAAYDEAVRRIATTDKVAAPAAEPVATDLADDLSCAPSWKESVRAIADELHARDAAAGAYSSLKDMSERISNALRETGPPGDIEAARRITGGAKLEGRSGPLSPGNILREALQGGRWTRK